jgi:hypothetical protein
MKLTIGLLWLSLAVLAQTGPPPDPRLEKRERETFDAIERQLKANGAGTHATGPFLADTGNLARRLLSVLSQSYIEERGLCSPAGRSRCVELHTRGWEIQIMVKRDAEGAAHEMAYYLGSIAAAYQPGTASGILVGQVRYHHGNEAIVFLRQNVVVWVRKHDYPNRYATAGRLTKECEALAKVVDHELVRLLGGK